MPTDGAVGRPHALSYANHTSWRSEHHARVRAVRAYLSAVYPAARRVIHGAADVAILEKFAALDYYYSCESVALGDIRPPLKACAPIARWEKPIEPPPLPFLPRGAYYRVSAPSRQPFADASWTAHPTPVHVLRGSLSREGVRRFRSQSGAKAGPAPSWTSPLAIARYPLHPTGLAIGRPAAAARGWRPARVVGAGQTRFEVANQSRVQQLLRIRHGDLIEVEQWGGFATADCPPICGLWGNVYKGTGVAMRVTRPFASLSKVTAIVQMILDVGARSAAALSALARRLHVVSEAAAARARHPQSTIAESVAHAVLTVHDNPCEGASSAELRPLVQEWVRSARARSPREVVAEVLGLGGGGGGGGAGGDDDASRRLRLLWIFSICGVGPMHARCGLGWDALIATLACLLGHGTVVLAASPNDNGLLHQEFVDYDLPDGLGWGAPPAGEGTNDAEQCFRSLGFAQADERSGTRAVAERRRQLLAYWQRTNKFSLPKRLTADLVLRASAASAELPCRLRFGASPAAAPEGAVDACRISPGDEERNVPTARLACYAWCEGTMSQAQGSVASLFHLRAVDAANS